MISTTTRLHLNQASFGSRINLACPCCAATCHVEDMVSHLLAARCLLEVMECRHLAKHTRQASRRKPLVIGSLLLPVIMVILPTQNIGALQKVQLRRDLLASTHKKQLNGICISEIDQTSRVNLKRLPSIGGLPTLGISILTVLNTQSGAAQDHPRLASPALALEVNSLGLDHPTLGKPTTIT